MRGYDNENWNLGSEAIDPIYLSHMRGYDNENWNENLAHFYELLTPSHERV